MSVLAIGISVYDITLSIEEPFIIDTKMKVLESYECAGGQASNAACVCGKWGLQTYMISRVGKDSNGKAVLENFRNNHVDTSYMRVLEDYATSNSIIINHKDCGKRTILNYQAEVKDISFTYPKDIDFLLLDAHEEKIGMQVLEAYKHVPSMLDAEKVNPLTLKYAKHVDYIVGSENFAKEYTGLEVSEENFETIITKIRELNGKNVVITLGERGLIYNVGSIVKHMDAFKSEVVDSTGAGDIFHGALVYGLHEGYAYEEALQYASLAASLSLKKRGGSTSIPNKEEVFKAC